MGYLSDSRVLLRHHFVHVTVKDDVDVGLQSDPDVVEFICQCLSGDPRQKRLVRLLRSLRGTREDGFTCPVHNHHVADVLTGSVQLCASLYMDMNLKREQL